MTEAGSPRVGGRAHLAKLAFTIAMYITLNSTLNLTNRWALGVYGFKFPFILTSAHMLFGFLVLLPYHLSHNWEAHAVRLAQQWRGLAAIGAFLACGISLNNISLVYISLSLNQVIRSAIPVVACLLSVVIEHRVPGRLEATSLVVLSLGVMIAVWQGTVAGQPLGIIFCMAGLFSSGAMVTLSSKLLSEQLNVLSLTFYTAPVSLLCLLPFVVAYELQPFSVYALENWQPVCYIVFVSSANALAYNVFHYLMIQRTSGVATTVVGEVKIVGLMILSALLLGEGKQFTPTMTLGVALALAGFMLYSHTKVLAYRRLQLQQLHASPSPAPHPLASSGGNGKGLQARSGSGKVLFVQEGAPLMGGGGGEREPLQQRYTNAYGGSYLNGGDAEGSGRLPPKAVATVAVIVEAGSPYHRDSVDPGFSPRRTSRLRGASTRF